MNYGVRIKFLLFAAVALAIMLVIYNTMMNRVAGESTTYRADFTSVSGLRPGDDVRAAGVRVGRVESIGLTDDNAARVEFTLGAGQEITGTTTISVRYQNLLGQRYLALQPGDEPGEVLDAAEVIDAAQTDPGFDLTALLNGFEPLFDTLEPQAVNQLATSLVAVLQGEGGTVEALLQQTATLTQDLAAKDEIIGSVLTNLTPVLTDFTAQQAEFTTTVDRLSELMTGLAAERDTLTGSIDGMSELAQAAASLTQQIRPDLDTTIASLRGVADVLVGHQASLDQLFAVAPAGFDSFTRPTNTGTWLNMYICMISIELTPGTVIDLGNPAGPYSAVCS
ncbi:MlaD family protein [Aeromicrobium alkaliterrae]|uniref:MCE family protein n=1 Tax=Aeromicrobium alkaliterrae TaxID=302168 RepID=A0ABN2JH71_9ACTN